MKRTVLKPLMCLSFLLCLFVGLNSFMTGSAAVGQREPMWFDLDGNIGPYKVSMHINYDAKEGEKCGYYYYKERPNNHFSLVMAQRESALAGCKMTIKEYTSKGVHSGTFKGYFATRGINFSGTFTNTKSRKQFKFELLEAE